jgi:RNA polymerase sigma-70 factor (ECF subfamily)
MRQRRKSTKNQPVQNTDQSDEYILALLQQTKNMEQGFRLLVEKYQERLYWHIRRLVIGHEDANDVLQNCFIKAFRGIGQFKGQSKLYTWLFRIATNEAITHLNRNRRKATSSLDDETNLVNQLKADVYFDGDEIQLQLQRALLHLPEKQRVVFNLRYYEEMPYKDMAKVLDTSAGALKASYHHAVKKIENYFKNIEVR